MMGRVAIHTLGCRANQSDSDSLEAKLSAFGFERVDFDAMADVYVVNTCTVTHDADRAARRLLRQAHRRNPNALIIATGCYAQVAPEELAKVEGVTYVIGNDRKEKVLEFIVRRGDPRGTDAHFFSMRRSRAYVKIQDGCNFRCSFCIIPFARGASRSRSIPEIISEIQSLAEQGYHEVILTGIHIGSYGWDLQPRQTLLDLMQALIAAAPIERVRLSTLDPDEVSPAMIDLMAQDKIFCPHLHIAIQSGSDPILKKMRRRHTTRQLQKMAADASQKIADLSLGADIITGFPSESGEEHRATKELLQELPLTYLHVFPYSERKKTAAASYPESVPVPLRRERAEELIALGAGKKMAFWKNQIGKKRAAILEETEEDPFQKAITDNFIPVWAPKNGGKRGTMTLASLDRIEGGKVLGVYS